MGLLHYLWSRTAASNATADSNVNWSEGQSPSSVNDSARAMMASAAGFRDDIAGAIVTAGTSTAYTVTSYQIFDTLAHMSGQMIAFTPHATNGATVTLNVDGLGAKPLRSSPGVELPAGSLILGTPYFALYNNSDAVWYLHGGVGAPNAYSIPLGCGMDCWAATAPSSIFALAQGQAISRTTYAALFTMFGTTYGVGDGSTTFNIPDKVGRVSAMRDAGSARISSSYFGGNPANLGAVGGGESTTLTAAQIPTITSAGTNTISVNSASLTLTGVVQSSRVPGGGASLDVFNAVINTMSSTGSNSISVTSNNTSGSAHRTVQPTIVCNYIIRVL